MTPTTAPAPPHWLLGLCDPERSRYGKPPVAALVAHPWLWLDQDGRTWTVATDARTLHLFLGVYRNWPWASEAECKMLAPFLGPVSGDLFAWDPFVRWLGPDVGRVPCSECQGTRRSKPPPEWDAEETADIVGADGKVECFCADGTEPAPPRPGRLRGACLNRNLLARGVEAAVRIFEEPDLVEVALTVPKRKDGRFSLPDLTGPVTVQTAGVPLWRVVVMPLTPQKDDDPGAEFPETTERRGT